MMTGKERVLNALSFKEVDRTPWVPYCGVQTANLLGMTAEEYLKDSDNIVKGILKAYELYKPDGLPVVFDLQIEPEALGCELKWAKDNPPAVKTHILDEKSIDELELPKETDGRYPIALDAARKLSEAIGDKVALYALICGPFTLALHLRGTKIFSDMKKRKEETHKLMKYCTEVAIDFSRMYSTTGIDVIAAVDPMTSQISPKNFKEYVTPYLTDFNRAVKEMGLKVTTFCCGDATKNIELMCQTEADGIAFDENVDLAYVRDIATKYNVSFGGNLPLTTVMLFGTPMENVEEGKKQLSIGGNLGYILAPGCDMPYHTPVNNIRAISYLANGESIPVEFLEEENDADESEAIIEDVEIEEGKVFLEVITLDSEGCAPCQYMCQVVKNIENNYGDEFKWQESLIKSKAGIQRVMKLGVTNLPSILINNELVYNNIIPTEDELMEEINKRLKK